jgi:hypothetical protein
LQILVPPCIFLLIVVPPDSRYYHNCPMNPFCNILPDFPTEIACFSVLPTLQIVATDPDKHIKASLVATDPDKYHQTTYASCKH